MDHILGQSAAIEVLTRAVANGRLHHGLIFYGPWGVGKFTTAVALAKILLCHDLQMDLAGNPCACDGCEACKLMDSSDAAHPDLHVIHKDQAEHSSVSTLRNRKRTNIPVDLLRERVVGGTTGDDKYHEPAAAKSPVMNHNKIFIIDEAELMAAHGQNALLKTLEEPSPGTFFILVTTSDTRLLPTIRSRCQRVCFGPLTDQIVSDFIAKADHNLSQQEMDWLLPFAAGSVGRAQQIIENNLLEWCQVVFPALEALTNGRQSPTLGSDMTKLVDDFAAAEAGKDKSASKEAANRMSSNLMLQMIAQFASRKLTSLSAQGLGEEALDPWLHVIDGLRKVESELASNVNMRICFEHLASLIARAFIKPAAVAR